MRIKPGVGRPMTNLGDAHAPTHRAWLDLFRSVLALDAMPGEDRFSSLLNMQEQSVGGGLGFTKIDDTYFYNSNLDFP